MMTLFAALLLAAIALVSLGYVLPFWLNPATAFSAVWCGLLAALWLSRDTFFEPSAVTLAMYVAGPACVLIGAMLFVGAKPDMAPGAEARVPGIIGQRALTVATAVLTVLLPAYLFHLYNAGLRSWMSDYWTGVRAATGTEGIGPFTYVSWAAHVLALVTFQETLEKRVSKLQCCHSIALALAYSLAAASRLGGYRLVLALLGIAAVRTGRLNLRMLLVAGLGVILIFAPMAVLLGKGGDRDGSVEENISGVTQSLQNYALGGLVAFDNARVGRVIRPDGLRSLRFFYAVSSSLRSGSPVPPMVLPFTETPLITNVYTIYYTYFFDYGWLGTAIAFVSIGFLSTALFCRALAGSPTATVLYGMLLSCLLLSLSDEFFLTGLSANLQAIAIVTSIYRIDAWARVDPHL